MFSYGSYPDIDALYQQQAGELDRVPSRACAVYVASPFPTLLDPCQGIVRAECAVVMQLRRLPRRSDRRAVPWR